MSFTMNALVEDCRKALKGGENPETLEAVRGLVVKALKDREFMKQHFAGRTGPDREVVHEDPELGFCVCLHTYQGAKLGQPHDHGPTWAIYGQAEGETEMTDWRVVTPAEGDAPARVEQTRSYTMKPGDAHIYPTGAIHAPIRRGPTKLLRIEGKNTDKVRRTPIEPA